jgi:hypothetical protein
VAPTYIYKECERVRYDVHAKRDSLSVDFIPEGAQRFYDVWLTGPAVYVAEIYV